MRKQFLLTLALSGLTALLVAQSPPPPPAPTVEGENKQELSATVHHTSKDSPTPIVGPVKHDVSSKENNDEKERRSTNQRIDLLAWVVAFAAVAQFVAAMIQAWIMKRGLKATELAADAATQGAKTAENSVALASESSRLDQRPWLTLTTVDLLKDFTAYEPPEVVVTIENSGRTPALDVTIQARIFARADFTAEHLMTKTEGKVRSRAIIGPGTRTASMFGGGTNTLGEAHMSALAKNKSRLYISGFIDYRDVFDCWHKTSFCFWISGKDIKHRRMVPCDIGNVAT